MTHTIEELKKLAEAATKGPWKATPDQDAINEMLEDDSLEYRDAGEGIEPGIAMQSFIRNPANYLTSHRIEAYDTIFPSDQGFAEAMGNLRFIAAARTAVPELIAEVDRLRKENLELRREVAHRGDSLWP